MVDTSINKEKYCSLITQPQSRRQNLEHCSKFRQADAGVGSDSLTPDIIFIPTQSGGYYVNRSKATIVSRGGYGRLEFELSAAEIAKLESEDPNTEVWGDEADLVFPRVQADWVIWIMELPSVKARFEDNHVRQEFDYWVRVDENNEIVESW